MKSLFLTLLLLGGLSSAAVAQKRDCYAERPGSLEPSLARVDGLMRQMSSQLKLNEAQYIRLRTLNQSKLARLDALDYDYPDAEQRRLKSLELEAQYEADCSRILTPSQLSLFQAEQPQQTTQPTPTDGNDGGIG